MHPKSFTRLYTCASVLVFSLLIIPFEGHSQGKLLGKMIAKVSKATGSVAVSTTSTLEDVLPTVGIGSNLHPTELGTISQSFFPDWSTGGQQVYIMFTRNNAPGFVKIDGSVKVNGTEIDYVTSGMYSIIGGPSASPRKVDIKTSSGETSSFVIEPFKNPIKLLSINGKDNKISLDLSQDVILELEGISPQENPLMKVSLAINQIGIKSIYDVCFIRSGSKVTIPAAAFRNINIVPGGNALYNYKNSFLSVTVENTATATGVTGIIPSVQYTQSYMDGKLVSIATEPVLNPGVKSVGEANKMKYDFFKPNAFLSRPVSQIKKVGLLSFAIRGTTYRSVVTGSTTNSITTAELRFPQQPNEVWDALMEKLYPELMAVITTELKCNEVPVAMITGSTSYGSTVSLAKDDENTDVAFARSFRDTKVISAFMPVSEGYGVSSINQKIMEDTGTDALVTMTLDLEIGYGDAPGKFVSILMTPKFAVEISGKANGAFTSTKFSTGTIMSTTGVKVPVDLTLADLEGIVRKSDLVATFRQALHDLVEKEKANTDYETVWSLQGN